MASDPISRRAMFMAASTVAAKYDFSFMSPLSNRPCAFLIHNAERNHSHARRNFGVRENGQIGQGTFRDLPYEEARAGAGKQHHRGVGTALRQAFDYGPDPVGSQ